MSLQTLPDSVKDKMRLGFSIGKKEHHVVRLKSLAWGVRIGVDLLS
ncbi:hypothetical protein [Pseudobacteriovorax antillogorgiicola]|nr:hypothetical protein [Pseudobacteriovorax antillogorgiicola]